jgi:ribosomal protein S18 acetylase RimI-like enzyme
MSSIVTVEADENDLPAVVNLLTELSSTLEQPPVLDQQQLITNCLSLFHDPHAFILLAKEEGKTVGLIDFSMRRTALHSGPSALIDELIVAKDHRGKGIGSSLLTAAIDKCRQLGCCEIEVSTETSNEAAKALYHASGFRGDSVLYEMDL